MFSARMRTWSLVCLACAGILIFLLVVGLPGLELKPGVEVRRPLETSNPVLTGPTTQEMLVLVRGILALLVIILPFALLVSLFTREGRQRALAILLLLGLIFLLANLARDAQQEILPTPLAAPADLPTTPQPEEEETTPEVDTITPSEPLASPALDWGILLGLGGALAAGVAWLVWRLAQNNAPSTLQKLAEEARDALDAIQAGSSAEDAIVQCYEQMCREVAQERAVERSLATTPAEFIQVLTRMGLPSAPVIHLTQMFEAVRYGNRQSTPLERQDAIQCLTAILEACPVK